MAYRELLEKAANRFRLIADDTNRITSGNLSHNLTCLRGFALRAAESIERHLQEQVKEVDLEKELDAMITPELKFHKALPSLFDVAKHFFELGLKVQKGEEL